MTTPQLPLALPARARSQVSQQGLTPRRHQADAPATQVARLPASPRERFEAFHAANPDIYRELVRFARQARAAGRDRIGVRLVWERLRWDLMIKTVRAEHEPKLNDHLTRYYARLIMANEPDLAGIFEIRGRT